MSFEQLLQAAASPELDRLRQSAMAGRTAAVTELSESQAVFIASRLAYDTGLRVLVLTANDIRATHDADDAAQLLGEGVTCLPGGEIDLTRGSSSQEGAWRRLEALASVCRGETRVLCASMDAAMQRMGSPEEYARGMLTLRPGDQVPPTELMARMTRLGYERVQMVEGKGQCALRGSILDIYPPDSPSALRIEFFDDEVDSVRAFDCISQRSQDRMEEARLSPAAEVLLPVSEASAAARRMRAALQSAQPAAMEEGTLFDDLPPIPEDDEELSSFFDQHVAPAVQEKKLTATRKAELQRRLDALMADAQLVEDGLPFRRARAWLPVLSEQIWTLMDWFHPQVIVLCSPDVLRERTKERIASFSADVESAVERGEAVSQQSRLLLGWEDLTKAMADCAMVTASDLTHGLAGIQPKEVISLHSSTLSGYSSQLRPLAEDIRGWTAQGCAVALLSGGVARGKRLCESLAEFEIHAVFQEEDQPIAPESVTVLPVTLSHGFVWPEAGLVVVSDTDIWGAGYRKARSRRSSGEKIAAFTDLHPGDYVVHEDHGVGIYQGTVRMQSEGSYRDYMLIQYAGNDKLYVPIEQLQRVQRYIGNPSQPPKLNRIGGSEWGRQKGRVKESLRKLAFDLTQLYARRAKTPGYAFGPDTPWQREFEDQFPYELTPDQAQSVREITADMEAPRNMDRLLVGDVGYGKTEVSLRAAFKAVMDGKQVAMLAPTTILAQQHYNTIVRRFSGFPIRAEVISRFRTLKEQKKIIEDVAAGRIDILVGTHRLLAKDVKFKDLGLLIVDEEQRFGVQHKELIKNMKSQVDVLTLSATPIPRTLHMSMVGIRDMSVLETPPEDRLPVQTHVVEYSDAVVRDAILRELSRGGQVYFLYNRVQSIERFYQRLRALVPEARIGVAHGQMKEHGLEDMMMDFYGGSYDVLLCTTIIESGLDVPTANTLIVFDADRFGLSQLYQLRGRVGRSARQAYAYFTVRPDKMLSETAEQRLNAIREFTEFGAGFRIAMRDLEIRGAGNLLGPEQHGHLATVGYEMYCRLIEETVAEARGVPDHSELSTRVDLHVDAFLPDDYVTDEHQRMEMYKRISSLMTDGDRADIVDELVDRFGDVPEVVNNLLDVAQMRALASHIGVSQVTWRRGSLVMRVDDRFVPDPVLLLRAMQDTDGRLSLTPRAPTSILLKGDWVTEPTALREGLRVMRTLCARLDELTAAKERENLKEKSDRMSI